MFGILGFDDEDISRAVGVFGVFGFCANRFVVGIDGVLDVLVRSEIVGVGLCLVCVLVFEFG